jgi:hypothetical protein
VPSTTARTDFITREYRTTTSTNSAVLTTHPLAEKLTIDTFINEEVDADTLADAILDLRDNDRFTWTFTLSADKVRYNLIIGATYTITHPRFGLASGKNFILRGFRWSSSSKIVEAIFFGPQ